ncbi:hypothetical protein ANCDUO_22854 [Ancylostoma duodenale]|uniref:Uncharacterized protein n=1 Tax=Ancylostoma duodenale TaxID=51022 RepID=A0A0C2BT65_9BILA|nr:hypothetical protein ANCDUO_22854 [Ancylostoma duodenale]
MAKLLHGDTDDEVLDETVCLKLVILFSLRNILKQEMTELQQRIDAVLAEKAKLESELKKISVNNRLAEERRRKLQDMEKQLAQFRKQMNEMKKLEKQRQQSEETQKRMQAEIVELKKERKRDIEAAREKRVHDQQMLVYKQKLEDASKVNKRLQAQMERAAAFSREKPESEKSLSHAKQFIEAELALVGSSYEAELMCQSLKDQRRQLGRKKARLQRQRESLQSPDEPLPKRRSTEQGPALSPEDEETLKKIDEELKNIDQQQILWSAPLAYHIDPIRLNHVGLIYSSDELNKLQRGCGSVDVDSRSEVRWKDLYTVAAARVYLKVLFEQSRHSSGSRPLGRSRSSSCIDPAVLTTEEERRTRSSRARIHRFGDTDELNPLRNATLVSGLVPDLDPDLGPL